MTERDQKIIAELLEKYSETELNYYIKLEKSKKEALENLFISYLYTTNKDPKTNKLVNPCVSYPFDGHEDFSNGISSVFTMKQSIIKPNWLKGNYKIANKPVIYDVRPNEQIKEKVQNLVIDNSTELSLQELVKLVTVENLFSITELKLIQELLKRPQIYLSNTEPAVIVTAEKGSAYILGKDKHGQRTI